ncbi:uncharacterized protein BJ171DRAFT_27655 [Polychytrium aggregatum]|uniref:uncharacterized protein n=1 Tax=Polychytrium aggregatum TaxID=110093 RepID=UPI0022FE95C8|nr:uncharacterized protein BJ171DRAFT_27614 [Polychytrium aggregatum]XP_052968348.1 uncharacterized protein BJ171DRAFT_27655 [Polychytrium aggregatum]KAI9206266.1 hypothetical protein BJ171DRAFT_27614 [Polychytrium aggregatum]KAI9206268.1 hypothetical protein BJ171DRAFT_27655 [Polychytrium aggregatum]
MASMNEPAPTTESSPAQQTQAEARTASSMPDITRLSLNHGPDIFTIICCNDSFQLALDHSTIKALLRACKRAQPLLSSKVARFNNWCQNAGLCNPDGQLQIGLTPSDTIALSLHCDDQGSSNRFWLVAQADQGDAAASYLLARILQVELRGQQLVDPSERVAQQQQIFHLMEKAANAHHSIAQFHLAGCYHDGTGVDQDHTKSAELYRNLAERGIPKAQIVFGGCYEIGEGVDQDFDTAIEWYSKAVDQGSDDGRLHIEFLRGWRSFLGHGVEQSDRAALAHWQEVSSQSTNSVLKPIATHMVGWMYYLGRGTVQDEQKGIKIIRDNKSDQFKLGEAECLESVWKVVNNASPVAHKYFELCQLGSDREWLCRHLMAVCVFHGFGTPQDWKKAANIFEQLANEGHSDSQNWIGECYLCGWGVSEDYKKAFEWYSKSADQGNSYGQFMVGFCYFDGYGVTQDYAKAVEWYCKSAEQGNRYGQHWLGFCYKNGHGVPEDIDTAVFWYRKSADQDCQAAINSLKELGKWP